MTEKRDKMKNRINVFLEKVKEKKITIAFAESVTCGMLADKLATGKGTSDVLTGSIVCYTPEVKTSLLKISKSEIDKYTCESPEVTEAMASSLATLMEADVHAAVTGLASEGGSETAEKPVGTIFYCIRYKGKNYSYRKLFKGSPLQIREKACFGLYDLILSLI